MYRKTDFNKIYFQSNVIHLFTILKGSQKKVIAKEILLKTVSYN